MNKRNRIFNILTILFVIILFTWLTEVNYNDLSFNINRSAYLGIFSNLIFIFVMQFAKKHQKNQ